MALDIQLSVRLKEDTIRKLKKRAEAEQRTTAQIARMMLERATRQDK